MLGRYDEMEAQRARLRVTVWLNSKDIGCGVELRSLSYCSAFFFGAGNLLPRQEARLEHIHLVISNEQM